MDSRRCSTKAVQPSLLLTRRAILGHQPPRPRRPSRLFAEAACLLILLLVQLPPAACQGFIPSPCSYCHSVNMLPAGYGSKVQRTSSEILAAAARNDVSNGKSERSAAVQRSNSGERRRSSSHQRQHSTNIKDVYSRREKTVVILYNKPPNIITSHSSADLASKASNPTGTANNNEQDTGEHRRRMTVYEDVMTMAGYISQGDIQNSPPQPTFEAATGIYSKLHAVGRLDADTTGLLLLTNDGGLVHRVTNPTASSSNDNEPFKKLVTKTYEALIMGHHDEESPALHKILYEGVDLGPKYGKTQPAVDLRVLSHPTVKSTLVSLTIAEGKNRQVRRTFHAVGSGVMKLKRTKIGDGLRLGELQEGQWRTLSDDEVESFLGWRVRNIDERDSLSASSGRYEKRARGRKRRRR